MDTNKHDLFNWFETEEMKKLLPKNDYDFSATDIAPNSRILCCGMTGSGKTTSLLHYIRLSPNLFSRIIVFTKEMEPVYELLQKGLKGKVEFHFNLSELPTLKNLRAEMDDKEERILLVLDDFMMELKNNNNINDYLIRGRKCNVTLFILAQNYFSVPKPLRNQMTYLLLYKMISRKDVALIISEFSSKDFDVGAVYKQITNVPLQFLKIRCSSGSDETKLSRNFTDFLPYHS